MDFVGLFHGKMILVVIDSHLKWIEAFPTNSATSHGHLTLTHIVCTVVLVTDNGACFVSQEFESFLLINHVTSAPFHLAINHLAE